MIENYIRSAFALAGSIVIIYLFVLFYFGSAISEKIEGVWQALDYNVDSNDKYIFEDNILLIINSIK